MKHSMIALCLTLSFCTSAWTQPAAAPASGKTRVMDPAARSNMLAKTGGLILSPATGPSILFLNTQKRLPAASFQETPDQIKKILRLPCETLNAPSTTPIADAVAALNNTNIAAVIVIGDEPGYPSLLVAPESRWVLVNVDALSGTDIPPEKLAERVQKEVWRAFGYVMGAANSNMDSCLLKPVFNCLDLDSIAAVSLSPEPLNKIVAQSKKLGMQQTRMITYRKAVEEGWAPAPTNDFQRTIWNDYKK